MKQPTHPKCVNGIWFAEDDLTGAIFHNATITTTGQCTKEEARQAARMMLAAPELLDAANWASTILAGYLSANSQEERNYMWKDLQHAGKTLDAAIAKATGQD